MLGPADPFRTWSGAVPANGLGPERRCCRTTRWSSSTRRCSTSGWSASPSPSPSPSPRWSPDGSTRTGRARPGAGRCSPGPSSPSASCSAPGGRTRCSAGAASGPGTRSRTPSLLPWLVGTAYLHSVMVQERRGLLRIWNLSLVIATFSLTILGTFLTRSGVIQSVHSFSTSTIGPLLLGFFGVVAGRRGRADRLAGRPAALAGRDRLADQPRGRVPRQQPSLRALRRRRAARHGVPAALRGARRPASRSPSARPTSTGLVVPVGLGLLFLMAVAPALPWRKTHARGDARPAGRPRRVRGRGGGRLRRGRCARRRTPARLRSRRVRGGLGRCEPSCSRSAARGTVRACVGATPARAVLAGWRGFVGRANGGMVVHIGVVVIAVGLAAATAYGQRGEVRLVRGPVDHLRRAHRRVRGHPERGGHRRRARVRGGPAGRRRRHYFPGRQPVRPGTQPVGTPAIDSSWRDDVYLTIDSIPDKGGVWTFGVVVQPLVRWLWVGGALVVLGAVLSALPGRRRRPTDPVSAPVPGAAGRGETAQSERRLRPGWGGLAGERRRRGAGRRRGTLVNQVGTAVAPRRSHRAAVGGRSPSWSSPPDWSPCSRPDRRRRWRRCRARWSGRRRHPSQEPP